MEKISAPVRALDNESLENVSGGAVDPMEAINLASFSYGQFNQLASKVLDPWKDDIDQAAFNAQYGNVIKVLNSYNTNTKYTLEEKAEKYAASWNKLHPGGGILSTNGAMYLLSIPDIKTQVAVSLLPSANEIENAAVAVLKKLNNG